MTGRRALLIASLALARAAPCGAVEIQDVYRGAYEAYLQGRLADASSAYRYLDALGVDGAAPTINLALLARDEGDPETALPLWIKATLLAPADPFPWNQRGWCYLSMGRARDARDSFRRALAVSSTTAMSAEAQLGLGMTEQQDAHLRAAISEMHDSLIPNPYLLAAATAFLGRIAARLGLWSDAEVFFKQSLIRDPRQPEILRELGDAYERGDSPKAAWLAFRDALSLDPADADAAEGMARMARLIDEPPSRLVPARRLAGPMLREPAPPPASDATDAVRVGLYSDATGEPGFARRFFFVSGSDFRIVDPKLGQTVDSGQADEQWEAAVSPETGVVELRDVHGQLRYTTKQAFRIEPSSAGASVLIKSPEFADLRTIDIGDLEARGALEVVPTPRGMQIVNEVGLEEYLFGRVGAALPERSPLEALKAEAVALRTRVEWLKHHGARDAVLRLDTCDSPRCGLYQGLAQESDESRQAVLETSGVTLARDGQAFEPREHPSCAGRTEDGAVDDDAAREPRTAYDLELRSHGYPDPDLFDSLSALPPPSWLRWVRILDGDRLRARLGKDQDIGRLHHVRVARRSATGRAQALEIVGAHGRTTLDGEDAVGEFLSPGGLPSTYFTLQPVYDGRALRWLVVWGMGTGDGRGMCVAGALGMAQMGKDYKTILEHYFPGATVLGWRPSSGARSAARGPGARAGLGKSRRVLRARQKARARASRKRAAASGRKGSPAASRPPGGTP